MKRSLQIVAGIFLLAIVIFVIISFILGFLVFGFENSDKPGLLVIGILILFSWGAYKLFKGNKT